MVWTFRVALRWGNSWSVCYWISCAWLQACVPTPPGGPYSWAITSDYPPIVFGWARGCPPLEWNSNRGSG